MLPLKRGTTHALRSLSMIALLAGFTATATAEPELAERRGAGQRAVSTMVQGIGDAENATFTSDGRLFVTGGANVYEVTKRGSGFVATALYDGTCNFTGIVEHAGYLYTTCVAGTDLFQLTPYLLAAPLAPRMAFEVVHRFRSVGFPNGLAVDARGRLFVTDFTPLAGKVVTVSLEPGQPARVAREEVWHGMGHLLANGLKIHRDKVYLTDLGDLKVIPIQADGAAGPVKVLASRLAVLDDLYVSDDGIIAGDFYGGQLLYYTLSGRLVKQTPMLFSAPSSITPARGPLVPPGALVVTEKGALGELSSTDGNRVTIYMP